MDIKNHIRSGGMLLLGLAASGGTGQAEESASALQTAISSTVLSGSINTSAIWKFGSGNASMPGRMFDVASRQDGFNLDSFVLRLERPLDEGSWSAGYVVEMLYGADAPLYGTSPSFPNLATSDLAIKQAYVALRAPVGNGITFKVGAWDTIVGYEVYDYASNPTFSRSYGFFLEPFTHTGIQAAYSFTDNFEAIVGVANSRGNLGINQINGRTTTESGLSYMGTLAFSAPDSWGFLAGSTLYVGAIDIHQDGSTAPLTRDRINLFAGATANTPIEGLLVGAAYDYAENNLVNNDYANALAGYLSYQLTERVKLNNRIDYTWATDGTYFADGSRDEYLSLTTNVDVAVWANVVTRLELRWDRDLNGSSFGDLASLEKNAVSLALNVIYKF